MKRILKSALFCALLLSPLSAAAELSSVHIPLDEYQRLIRLSEQGGTELMGGFGRGQAEVSLLPAPDGTDGLHASARVPIKVFEDRWTFVPLLPAGSVLLEANVNGAPVELISTPSGLFWGSNKAGSYKVDLRYSIPTPKGRRGASVSIPLPPSSGTGFRAELPSFASRATVAPATDVRVTPHGDAVTVEAHIASAPSVLLSYQGPSENLVISRAAYTGELIKDAVHWTGEIQLESSSDEEQSATILPSSVTLREVTVDNKPAVIERTPDEQKEEYFAAKIRGRGAHTIRVEFDTPVARPEGLEQIILQLAQVPVSRFTLKLPGTKEIKPLPEIPLTHEYKAGTTLVSGHLPFRTDVTFRWTEAVPEEDNIQVRASAELYHRAHAEEGLLAIRTSVLLNISRGETESLRLRLPAGLELNRVESTDVGIVDFRTEEAKDGFRPVTVYFDRKAKGDVKLELTLERSLGQKEEEFAIPLVQAEGLERRKGMLILLSTKELALQPAPDQAIVPIGENQIPPSIRQATQGTVSHVFKFGEEAPALRVKLTEPVKVQGKFDADVHSLISLSDVAVRATSTVDVRVKSGSISQLRLQLPPEVNLLSLSAPSLRSQTVTPADVGQSVLLDFTQEIEGEIRIELSFERILSAEAADLSVPTVHVNGAEVEQGKFGVEALSALEVVPGESERLLSVEPSELPKQVVMKASHPLLLGYKYVRANPPPTLRLNLKHHAPLAVQSAVIDRATYHTLMTEDGIAVTSAAFAMRNTTEQFLRLVLPPGSEVWAASVNGKAEKPAVGAGDAKLGTEILLKILNSAEPFNVEVIFQTTVPKLGYAGRIRALLPRPSSTVTHTSWELSIPSDLWVGWKGGNMRFVAERRGFDNIAPQLRREGEARGFLLAPPEGGRVLHFEKLYANKSAEDTELSLPYVMGGGRYGFVALAVALAFTALRRLRRPFHWRGEKELLAQ